MFLRNLLLCENNPLHNRTMHISGALKEQYIGGGKKQYIGANGRLSNAAVTQKPPKQDSEPAKQDFGSVKQDFALAQQISNTFLDAEFAGEELAALNFHPHLQRKISNANFPCKKLRNL